VLEVSKLKTCVYFFFVVVVEMNLPNFPLISHQIPAT